MVSQLATISPKAHALARALERAVAERLIAYKHLDGTWTCKTYTLTVTGDRPQDVACSCIAGAKGMTCKHLAVVAFARKYGVRPVQPAAPVMVNGMDRRDPLFEALN